MTNQKLTNPTFQELLNSKQARGKVEKFFADPYKGDFWMCEEGQMHRIGNGLQFASKHPLAVWQGWLQEAPELSIADTERDKEIADLQQTIGLLKHKIDGLEAEIEMLEADYGDRGWII